MKNSLSLLVVMTLTFGCTPAIMVGPPSEVGSSYLSILPSQYDFGYVSLNHSPSTTSFTLKNTTTLPIQIQSISDSDSNNTSVTSTTCPLSLQSLAPGDSCQITIGFNPKSLGPLSGVMSILFSINFTQSNYTAQFSHQGFGCVVDPTLSSLTALPSTLTADNISQSTLSVLLKDSAGGPVAGKQVTLTSNRASDTISLPSGLSDEAGLVTFEVQSTQAGISTYHAKLPSDYLTLTQTALVTYESSSVSPTTSTLSALPNSNIAANNVSQASLTVSLLDSFGNPVSGKTVSLSSSRPLVDTITPVSPTSGVDGKANFLVKSQQAGTSVFSATDVTDSNLLLFSTASVSFVAGPASQSVSTIVSNVTTQAANLTATITVTLLDAFSNPVPGKSITLNSSRFGADTISPSSTITSASGVATFNVSTHAAGTSIYSAVDQSDSLFLSSTQTIVYTPAVISSSLSSVTGIPVTVLADGASQSTLTVIARDSGNQVIPGVLVSVSSNRGGAADVFSPSSATTASDGSATFNLTSLTPGYAIITATIPSAGTQLIQMPNISFVSEIPSLDFQAALASSGASPGMNSPPTTVWKNLTETSTLNDGILRLFSYTTSDGWISTSLPSYSHALAFDGTSGSYLDLGSSMNSTSDTSFEMWFRPTISSTDASIFSSVDPNNHGLKLNQTSSKLVLGVGQSGPTCTSRSPVVNGIWTHFVGVVQTGANALTLYKDGAAECSASLGAFVYRGSASDLFVGTDSALSNAWRGQISEFRTYVGSLLASEVVLNYKKKMTLLSFGSVCPAGSDCYYSGVSEGGSGTIVCASGKVINYVNSFYGKSCGVSYTCQPHLTPCLGQNSCSLTYSSAVCTTDPAPGCVKNGEAEVICSQ